MDFYNQISFLDPHQNYIYLNLSYTCYLTPLCNVNKLKICILCCLCFQLPFYNQKNKDSRVWSCQIFYCQLNYYSSFSIISFIGRLESEPASRRTFMRLTLNWGKIYLSLLEPQGGEAHHFIAGTQPSVQLYFLLQSVNKKYYFAGTCLFAG